MLTPIISESETHSLFFEDHHLKSTDQFQQEVGRLCQLTVNQDSHTRGLYATDASIYQVMPLAVVIPESTKQACEVLKIASKFQMPILPRGGGTSLAGQCVNEAVVIDFSGHCHATLHIDAPSQTCQVEAGKTIDDLNDELLSIGLFFAPDPSTARQANIGGCIGNNAAGVHSVLYGRTSENIIAVDACLANGTRLVFGPNSYSEDQAVRKITDQVVEVVSRHAKQIRDRFPKTKRRSSGYQLDVILDQLEASDWDSSQVNLAPLLCGSEGTLAVTLGATLKLHQLPKVKGLALLAFDSLDAAIAAIESILSLQPAGVELLDDLIIDLARNNAEYESCVGVLPDPAAKAVLFVEFFGETIEEIQDSFVELKTILPERAMATTLDQSKMQRMWALRKAGEPLLHAIKGNRKPLGFIEDNAVPVEHLGEFVRRVQVIVEAESTIASYYAHASVGVLHIRPLLDLRDGVDEQAMHRIAKSVADLAKELGGVPSGEHGDGRVRGPFVEEYFGSELVGAFREIKAIFDPQGVLNPGNIVSSQPVESISERTRIKPSDRVVRMPQINTYYRYDTDDAEGTERAHHDDGFGHAVELCNGAGVCRKKQGGLMCPSYQATLEERHSTRGRGNALRLAITGQTLGGSEIGSPDFLDEATKETLDLCLSCKGCKSECPSSVDVAKLKSEFLAQRYNRLGQVPMSVRVMSNIHRINRLSSMAPAMTNWINRFAPVQSIIRHALKIHPNRTLPEVAHPVRRVAFGDSVRPKVLVLSDTFSTHNAPQIVESTIRVLKGFGYCVGVELVSDLGRSAISFGNLPHAIKDAQSSLEQLAPFINDSSIGAFVLPEPSCLSVVLDDWNDLDANLDLNLLKSLQSRIALPETFIDQQWDTHPMRPSFGPMNGKIHIHGHCHQKALWGTQTSSAIFSRIYPNQTHVMDTGCCGMAGAFGYGEHRYDLSMRIGEMTLFPAVRLADAEDLIVAPGTSCRHQILDGTHRHALHPIEAIDRMMQTS